MVQKKKRKSFAENNFVSCIFHSTFQTLRLVDTNKKKFIESLRSSFRGITYLAE